jgi:hypothetical protein
MHNIPALTNAELNRFWCNVEKIDDGCWEWTGPKDKKGYGKFAMTRNKEHFTFRAHRMAFFLKEGYLPEYPKLCLCHTCDNRKCVRPDHLFIGTPLDNVQDMIAKGRSTTKLNKRIVMEILDLYASGRFLQRELYALYNVSDATMSKILSGKTWAHLGATRFHRGKPKATA